MDTSLGQAAPRASMRRLRTSGPLSSHGDMAIAAAWPDRAAPYHAANLAGLCRRIAVDRIHRRRARHKTRGGKVPRDGKQENS